MVSLVKQRGMTLIEVMVASAILTLVLLGVLAVAIHTQRSTLKLEQTSQANWAANNILAEIRAGVHGKLTETGSLQGQLQLGDSHGYWQAKARGEGSGVIFVTLSVHANQNKPPIVIRETGIWSPSP